jgi:hypothetical protein
MGRMPRSRIVETAPPPVNVRFAANALTAAVLATVGVTVALTAQVDVVGTGTGSASYRYVNPSRVIVAGEATDGLSWKTAFTSIPATPTRGLTYYLADGNYAARAFSTQSSSTSVITIKKATVADHGEDTSGGWNSTMGDGEALFSGTLYFTTPYWVLDGTTSTRWATSGYGIRVWNNSTDAVIRFSAANITVRNVEARGNGGDGVGPAQSNDIFRFDDGSNNILISRCYAWNAGRCIFAATGVIARDVTIEHTRTGFHEGTVGGEHGELASMWTQTGSTAVATIQRWTYRYNLFMHVEGTGGLMFDGDTMWVYGNVFYREPSNNRWAVGNGVIGAWSNNEFGHVNVKVYNNTFINCNTSDGSGNGGGPLGTVASRQVSGNEARNNIFMNGGPISFALYATHSHNHYINLAVPTDTGSTTSTVNPFVNYPAFDFHLAVDMTAGFTLASPFDVDPDGVTRATWDRGAFEKV